MPEKGFAAWLDNNKFAHKHPEIWKYIKFFLVGTVTSLPDLGSYLLFLYLFKALQVNSLIPAFSIMERIVEPAEGFSMATVVYAYLLSSAIGYGCAFVLNRKATFHADSNVALSMFLYIVMVIFTIFVNGLLLGPFLSGITAKTGLPPAISESISKILCMMIPGVWTYPFSRFVIHRKTKEPAAQDAESAE